MPRAAAAASGRAHGRRRLGWFGAPLRPRARPRRAPRRRAPRDVRGPRVRRRRRAAPHPGPGSRRALRPARRQARGEPGRGRHDRRARARRVGAHPEAARVRPRTRRRRGIRCGAHRRERRDRHLHVPRRHGRAALDFGAAFGQKLGQFVTSIALGQAWLTTTLVAAAVTVLCFAVRNHTALVFVTVLAVASLVPMAQQGHAAGAAGHNAAIASLGLHLVFAAVWLGGLLTIVLLRRELDATACRSCSRGTRRSRSSASSSWPSRGTRTPRSASARGTSSARPTACSCSRRCRRSSRWDCSVRRSAAS